MLRQSATLPADRYSPRHQPSMYAREIAGIYRQPKTALESVARVCLHGVERRLRARFAAEEIVVLTVEGDGRRELKRPASKSF